MCGEEDAKLNRILQEESKRMQDIAEGYREYPKEKCDFCNKNKGLRYKHRKLNLYRIICVDCLEQLQLTKQWN